MRGGGFAGGIDKSGLLGQLFGKAYEVICIQEATEPLPSFDVRTLTPSGIWVCRQPAHTGITIRPASNYYTCYFYRWGTNPRCSLAIYTHVPVTGFGAIHSVTPGLRPMIYIRIGTNYIGNVHLPSRTDAFAASIFNEFRTGMNIMSYPGGYVIAGDFNMCRPYIDDHFPDWKDFHSITELTHQGGNIIDYIYYAGAMGTVISPPGFTSDHRIILGEII